MPFIVQSDEKLPVVLVITDQPELQLLDWLKSFFEAQNLQVVTVQPQEYLEVIQQLQTQDLWHYKTIAITGFLPALSQLFTQFEQSFEQPQLAEHQTTVWTNLIEVLSQSDVKPTFIVGQFSLQLQSSTQPFLEFLATRHRRTQNLLEQVSQTISGAQIIIGQDCFSQSIETLQQRGEAEFPLLFSLLCLEHRLLLDPQQQWTLQSSEDFFLAIGQQLLKPHQANVIVVRGAELSSLAILSQVAELIQTYFAYKPTLLPTPVAEPEKVVAADIVCQTQTEIGSFIELQVRTIPHALLKLEELTQRMERFKVKLRFEPHYLLGELGVTVPSLSKTVFSKAKPSQLEKNLNSETQNTLLTHPTETNTLPAQTLPKSVLKPSAETLINESVKMTHNNELKTLLNQSKTPIEPLNLEAELQNLFGQNRQENRSTRLKDKARVTQKIVSKSKRHKTVFYVGATLSSLGGVVLVLWLVFAAALHFTNLTWQRNLATLQENQPIQPSKISAFTFLQWQLKLYRPILREDFLLEAENVAELAQTTQDYGLRAWKLKESTGQFVQQILAGQGKEFSAQLTEQALSVEQQASLLTQLVEETKKLDPTELSPSTKSKVTDKVTTLAEELHQLQAAGAVLKIAPEILGLTTKQSWIVLLQDQQELRPTGGFVQAVGRLNFSQGLLTDSVFQSTYDLDNKLATKVAPPEEIKRFLGEATWYLRDSNWSPDFPTSAKQAGFFMQEISGQQVDGVAGLTFDGVKKLLTITGPIDLPELNEQISDRNLYDRLEFHAETKSLQLNGKTYDYVSLVLTKLMTKITQLPPAKLAEIVVTLGQLAQTKDLQLVSLQQTEAETWKQLGWDGAVIRPQCPNQLGTNQCVVDQLYQVDANIGINKVNPYVDKKVMDYVEVGENSVVHRRTVTYKNQAKLESWPQGSYRSYVKFLLGKNAVIQSLTIDNVPVPTDQLLSYLEQDDQVIAAPIIVPRQKTVTVELKYRLNHTYKAPFAYFFFNQKQPGSQEVQDILLSYQPALKPRLITPQADLSSQLLNFHFQRESQSFVGATFETTRK